MTTQTYQIEPELMGSTPRTVLFRRRPLFSTFLVVTILFLLTGWWYADPTAIDSATVTGVATTKNVEMVGSLLASYWVYYRYEYGARQYSTRDQVDLADYNSWQPGMPVVVRICPLLPGKGDLTNEFRPTYGNVIMAIPAVLMPICWIFCALVWGRSRRLLVHGQVAAGRVIDTSLHTPSPNGSNFIEYEFQPPSATVQRRRITTGSGVHLIDLGVGSTITVLYLAENPSVNAPYCAITDWGIPGAVCRPALSYLPAQASPEQSPYQGQAGRSALLSSLPNMPPPKSSDQESPDTIKRAAGILIFCELWFLAMFAWALTTHVHSNQLADQYHHAPGCAAPGVAIDTSLPPCTMEQATVTRKWENQSNGGRTMGTEHDMLGIALPNGGQGSIELDDFSLWQKLNEGDIIKVQFWQGKSSLVFAHGDIGQTSDNPEIKKGLVGILLFFMGFMVALVAVLIGLVLRQLTKLNNDLSRPDRLA